MAGVFVTQGHRCPRHAAIVLWHTCCCQGSAQKTLGRKVANRAETDKKNPILGHEYAKEGPRLCAECPKGLLCRSVDVNVGFGRIIWPHALIGSKDARALERGAITPYCTGCVRESYCAAIARPLHPKCSVPWPPARTESSPQSPTTARRLCCSLGQLSLGTWPATPHKFHSAPRHSLRLTSPMVPVNGGQGLRPTL